VIPRWRAATAMAIALGADALQIVLLPLFGEGFASPAADALDVVAAGLLCLLVGFHWVLIPSMLLEAMPLVDIAPTWTLAVAYILRARRAAASSPLPAADNPPALPASPPAG
jgi:hypothetical protein